MNDEYRKYHVFDRRVLPPAEVARLDAIEAHFGDSTATPDIPNTAWATSVRGLHSDGAQAAISIRVDAEVAAPKGTQVSG